MANDFVKNSVLQNNQNLKTQNEKFSVGAFMNNSAQHFANLNDTLSSNSKLLLNKS